MRTIHEDIYTHTHSEIQRTSNQICLNIVIYLSSKVGITLTTASELIGVSVLNGLDAVVNGLYWRNGNKSQSCTVVLNLCPTRRQDVQYTISK